jgi:hypothetical protein
LGKDSADSKALRSWLLLTVFVILFAGVNLFFSLRYPSLTLGYVVAQVLVHPIGLAWGRLPRMRVPLGRFSFHLNPGPWSIKEHALITIVRFPLSGDLPNSQAHQLTDSA